MKKHDDVYIIRATECERERTHHQPTIQSRGR